jgi:hypothetical protein
LYQTFLQVFKHHGLYLAVSFYILVHKIDYKLLVTILNVSTWYPLVVVENFTTLHKDSKTTYLDHAGSTLYSTSQLDSVHRHLTANLVGYAH